MNRISQKRHFGEIVLAVVLGLLVGQKASGNIPYLTAVGPPSLRFEFTATNNPLFMTELALPKPQEPTVSSTNALLALAAAKETNAAPVAGVIDTSTGKNPAGIIIDTAKNAETAVNPASELLNVTPQMINQYFRPAPVSQPSPVQSSFQSGDTILVPTELGFVPPIPPGSRAIYTSQ